ncbi:MAG TPA: ABC transporter permease [Tepidisphaeraceae bacterium]|jgi:putative ABC transport system permease protein|nr:ABC transporter permease [Tepidisphaeraceae bacterium]
MNLFQLVFKQMRQRALGTWLTLLSVLLGVALAVSIFLMREAGSALFGQTEYGYDVLIGVGKGSPLQLTLNTVYHIDKSPGNVPYWVYETLNSQDRPPRGSHEFNYNGHVKTAIPIAVGDTYKGRPIVGAPPKMFVSLNDLRKSLQEMIDKQRALSDEIRQNPGGDLAPFSRRQREIQTSLQTMREDLKKLARETTPLVERADPMAAPNPDDAKWRYGKPITFRADSALSEGLAASASLASKDAAGAVTHEQAVSNALEVIYKSAGAENGPLEYRPEMAYELAQGRLYHAWKLEAVLGSEAAEKTGLKIGDVFQATHGNPGPKETPDIHPEKWQVVGVLKPTHTAADRCLYIPLMSFYCIAEHEAGLGAQAQIREGKAAAPAPKPDEEGPPPYKLVYGDELDPDLPHAKDYIDIDTPNKDWEVSAIYIRSRGGVSADDLMYFIQNGGMHEDVQAVNPARIMQNFFDTFFAGSTTILLVIAALVSVVAAIGILVSIYNSVSARNREIAILRALGATRGRVLTLICVEAGLIGLFGAIGGLFCGHLLGGVGSIYLSRTLGQGFDWISTNPWEWVYLAGVVVIALIAGLVPATKAYRTPVATNLVAG